MTTIPEPQRCGSCGNYWFGAHSCYANDGLECIRLQAEIDHMKRAHAVEIAKVIEISERDHASAKDEMRKEIARLKAIIDNLHEHSFRLNHRLADDDD